MEVTRIDENMDFSKLKVPELKKELKSRHLSTAGNKTELMDRLVNFVKNKRDNGAIVDDLEEDLLNDEDDDHLDNDESDALLTDLEKTISESETPLTPVTKHQKRKSTSETGKSSIEDATKPKKLTLTRKAPTGSNTEPVTILSEVVADVKDLSNLMQTPVTGTQKPSSEAAAAANGASNKVIKLSELSVQERMEMRSKKFGTPVSCDAIKQSRAERFGVNDSSKTITSEGATSSVEVLKQRAKRFGVSVSPSITKLENMERLELRKNRFGAGAGPTVKNTSITACVKTQLAGSNKAKAARLERFK